MSINSFYGFCDFSLVGFLYSGEAKTVRQEQTEEMLYCSIQGIK